ncbi:MAG TPA: tetratricopeptide repeat protein [Candidatus Hydrogenedentes bacterium]|nr:tetratricopeptide repeat protein [Candidatus Hydrogenedentota bacterium]
MRSFFLIFAALALLCGCYEEHKPLKDTYVPKRHAQDLNNQAMAALLSENNEEALTLINQAVEEDPQFYHALMNKGIILGKIGRFEEALQALEKAISLRSDFSQAYLFQGVYSEKIDRRDLAQAAYAKAAECFLHDMQEHPLPQTALCRAIAVYLGTGKVGGLTEFNAVIAQFPDYVPARFLKEKILKGDRDYFMWWIAEQNNKPVSEKKE